MLTATHKVSGNSGPPVSNSLSKFQIPFEIFHCLFHSIRSSQNTSFHKHSLCLLPIQLYHSITIENFLQDLFELVSELLAHTAVDDEVYWGVDDHKEVGGWEHHVEHHRNVEPVAQEKKSVGFKSGLLSKKIFKKTLVALEGDWLKVS